MTNSFDSHLYNFLRLSERGETGVPDEFIQFTRFITHLGDGLFLAALSVLALAVLLYNKRFGPSLFWTVLIISAFLLSAGLKKLIGRQRPDDIYHLIETASLAFPSGHAFKSTVVYGGLYILTLHLISLSPKRKSLLQLLLILPLLIGVSRILLGVHWPSDVIAGWVFGALMVWIFSIALSRHRKFLA